MTKSWKTYIFWFAQEHVDFRIAEIDSIVKLFDLEIKKLSEVSLKPFWIVELPNEETAVKLASRSVSLRCIIELWSHTQKTSDLHINLQNFISKNSEELKSYFHLNTSFKINVETYNKHFTMKEKVEKIESFDYLPLDGSVNLKNPDTTFWYIEFYGLDQRKVPESPDDVMFGRWITDGRRSLINELSLKQRKFIGNTSMEAQLSLLMANQALVKKGDIVFDPFVGTGSLLVSAAKFEGYVLGSDIDYMMIHAKCRPSRITQKVRELDESIRANLKQYGCERFYMDVIVSDFSNSVWNDNVRFDSIITDPPYGIRESTETIKTKAYTKADSRDENSIHYPSTSHYSLQNMYRDLLFFAATHLNMNGRLVCWLPFHRQDYTDDMVPQQENLKLISNSEQLLCGSTSRRLLTYEKISEPFNGNPKKYLETELIDFRDRYFASETETRQARRIRKAELREIGRREALKRGKILDKNGKVVKLNADEKK